MNILKFFIYIFIFFFENVVYFGFILNNNTVDVSFYCVWYNVCKIETEILRIYLTKDFQKLNPGKDQKT